MVDVKSEMKAFRVFDLTRWGHEEGVKYYRCPISAEKDFYKRVRKGIESNDLPSRDDLDGGCPWKIMCRDASNRNIKLKADIRYWDSYHTDCGTEHSIEGHEIIFEQIDIL